MNKKEIAEIKRRLKAERSSITHLYGCYVNGAREIISYIDESLGLLGKEEQEQYLNLLKKTLSGRPGKNLLDLCFETKQVIEGEEHKLLSALRSTKLQDEALREQFYKRIIESLDMDGGNYLILLAHDSYDVPYRGKDGALHEDSSAVFNYILCCICPVKAGKAALGFDADEKRFSNHSVGQFVGAPELGFMFPAFDDRAANIYNALFYTHGTAQLPSEFIDAIFKTEIPMSAAQQKEAFNSALVEAVSSESSYTLMQTVHSQLSERLELHRESKDPEQPLMSVEELADTLHAGGMDDEHVEKFRELCNEQFGENALINPENLIDEKHMSLVTPQVKISVDPKFSHLIHTKVIDGKKYVLVSAESGVEVNGVSINIE